MREIRFRAFTGEEMRYDITGFEHGVNNEMEGIFIDGEYYTMDETKKDFHKYAEAMQYTGLKDKNGKEIYEGDILGILAVGNNVDVIGAIIFDTDLLSFTVEKTNGGWDYLTHFSSWKPEVIGNIYENPELLES